MIFANYLSQLKYINFKGDNNNWKEISYSNAISRINQLTEKSKFGTCVIINNSDTYFDAVKQIKNINNFEIFDIYNACGENVILFSPHEDINLKDYKNIFILDNYLCAGYLSSLSNKFNNVYSVQNKLNGDVYTGLDITRKTFGNMLNAIKVSKIPQISPYLFSYFNLLRKENSMVSNIKFHEFKFFLMVMEELGIIEIVDDKFNITNIKSNLENSSIYNFVVELLKIY